MGTEAGTGAGTGENRHENKEPGNLRSDYRGGLEDARRQATPTSNQQPHPQDPMPQRDRRIMPKTRAQGREARDGIGEGRGEVKKRNKPPKNCRRNVKNGGDLGGKRKKT